MYTNRFRLGILVLLFASSHAFAEDFDAALKRIKAGLPADVGKVIDRMTGCNHWAGEEAYDEDRKQQIHKAVDELRCKDLESDKTKLLKKYKAKESAIKKAFKEAETMSEG